MSRSWSSLRGRMRGYGHAVGVEPALVAGPAEVAHRVGRVRARGRAPPSSRRRGRRPRRRWSRAGSRAATGLRKPWPACAARWARRWRTSGSPGRPRRCPGRSGSATRPGPSGSPLVRRSCARSRPPSAVGGVIGPPAPPGGSPHGFMRIAELARSPRSASARRPRRTMYRSPSAPNSMPPPVWYGNCCAPVVDQHLLRARHLARRCTRSRDTRARRRSSWSTPGPPRRALVVGLPR